MKKTFLILIFSLLSFFSYSQDELKTGFTMLETGKFSDAAAFFKYYLNTKDSTNKTALLCYGRGVGLSGNVQEAKQVFSKLLTLYPNDYEISLNDAEALMWGKEYKAAKDYYERLLNQKPKEFVATLGYANALAALGEYEKSLIYTNKALEIQPNNEGAKISKKYAHLAVADSYSKKQDYASAEVLLDNIFKDFPNDIDALFAKAQLKMALLKYTDAEQIYKKLLAISKSKTDVYLNISYLAFLQKNKKLAYDYALKAVETAKNEPEKAIKAQLGKITALGWNEKFSEAFTELYLLEQKFPENNDILLKKASLLTWDKEYAKSARLFEKALLKSPKSFDGNLGLADALFAQELDVRSKKYVLKTLEYYPNQKDAKDFMYKINLRHAPSIATHNFLMSDKGGNSSKNYQLDFGIDLLPVFRLIASYKNRTASSTFENLTAKTDYYSLGFRWRIKPVWLMTTSVSEVFLQGKTVNNQHTLLDFSNEFKLTKRQTLELKYQSDVQNFTAGLIDRNLRFQNFIAIYNLNTPMKLGIYSQYYHTRSSDKNVRNLLFASLYYTLKTDPILKFGFNFNTMVFLKQIPDIYFSPKTFNSYELFGLIENIEVPNKKFLYQLALAGGYQQIEQQAYQSTYRITAALGYRPIKNFEALIYTLQSNSATSSVVGYAYSEIGMKAKWILLKTK